MNTENPDKRVQLTPSFSIFDGEVDDKRLPHVLITIPGIRDTGYWANNIKSIDGFVENKIIIAPTSVERISSISFVFGVNVKKINQCYLDKIELILNQFPENPISILCHSNGTKLLADILPKFSRRFEYVFLCGSVCHRKDHKSIIKVNRAIINDCGLRDMWPLIAEVIKPARFSATGRFGFVNFPIIDRYFEYRHRDYTNEDHLENWILPVITIGKSPRTNKGNFKFGIHAPAYIRRLFFLIILIVVLHALI